MALISDAEYIIHNLRLTYLRHVEDPFGSRIISVNPNYSSNAYILASGLTDSERWPELNITQASAYEEDTPAGSQSDTPRRASHSVAGFPAASGLKYSRTIRPATEESFALKSHRSRAQSQKESEHPLPPLPADSQINGQRSRSDSAPDPVLNGSNERRSSLSDFHPEKRRSIDVTSLGMAVPRDNTLVPPTTFKPPFARAAEMERRRKARIRQRARQVKLDQGLQLSPSDISSSSGPESLSPDSDFGEQDDDEVLDQRLTDSSSEDEIAALSAGSIAAAPEALLTGFASPPEVTAASVASPGSDRDGRDLETSSRLENSNIKELQFSSNHSRQKMKASLPQLSFYRIKPSLPVQQSLLTSLLAAQSSSHDNPFSELYASVAARGQESCTLSVYFPYSRTPSKPMELIVQPNASVEEVIGFSLWTYWEKKWKPALDSGCEDDEESRKTRLSAISWNLRIAEDDGEVDEDFPSLDRAKKISNFNFDAYAVALETSQAQIAKNAEHDGKLVRRPSRIRVQRKQALESTSNFPQFSSEVLTSVPNKDFTLSQFTSLSPSSYQGPPLFLRIRLENQKESGHVGTTIPVSAGMYMAEALELVCRKRSIPNPKEWALMLKEPRIPIPLDRTVASLQGKSDLLLIRRSDHPNVDQHEKRVGRTTDPNASILKRQSEIPQEQYPDDFTAAYKKYNVIRKLPVIGHNDRILAIDGDYIHIMPAGPKGGFLDSTKTSSYHAKNVLSCSQSGDPVALKLVVRREGTRKRYDFEAESSKQAEEIVRSIRSLQKAFKMDRGSTIKARRSRQIPS